MIYSLNKLIRKAKDGDKEALLGIILRFNPLIKRFSRELKYPEAETDLIIALLELTDEINIDTFPISSDGKVKKYIHKSLISRKIDLHRKHSSRFNEDLNSIIDTIPDSSSKEIFERIFIKDILEHLSSTQKEVIEKAVLYGYSDKEIAEMLHISRQAVNRTKNRALKILRRALLLKI